LGLSGKRRFVMKTFVASVCAALFLFGGFTALAQGDEYEKGVTEYSFDDENVLGDLVGPGGTVVTTRHPGKQKSLIKVRRHFIPEMFKSVEDI
jgi:hypothetical protein